MESQTWRERDPAPLWWAMLRSEFGGRGGATCCLCLHVTVHVNISSGFIVVFAGLVCVYFKSALFKMCVCVCEKPVRSVLRAPDSQSVDAVWVSCHLRIDRLLQLWLILVVHQQQASAPPPPVRSSLSCAERLDGSTFYNIYLHFHSGFGVLDCFLTPVSAALKPKTLPLCLYVCLSRAGQPRGQSDRDSRSGAPAAWEEQADAGAADETPGKVGRHTQPAAVLNNSASSAVMRGRTTFSLLLCLHPHCCNTFAVVVVRPRGGLALGVISRPHAVTQRVLKIESHPAATRLNLFPDWSLKGWR